MDQGQGTLHISGAEVCLASSSLGSPSKKIFLGPSTPPVCAFTSYGPLRKQRFVLGFYQTSTAVPEQITNCISVWYGNCNAADRKALQRVLNSAQRTIGCPLPPIHNKFHDRCLNKAKSIVKEDTHPNHGLFTLLPSDKRYRSLRSRTSRHKNSFFPEAVTLLNKPPPPV